MDRFKAFFWQSGPDTTATRIRRRKALVSLVYRQLSRIKCLLFLVGYIWMAAIPLPLLGQDTFVSENALQPGQVNTYWNWADVHLADQYLQQLEHLRDANFTSQQRANFMKLEFKKLGIPAATQQYTFRTADGVVDGTNVYAIFSSPRTSGTEAMVVSASWLSKSDDEQRVLNLRGCSTVLALASFLKRYSLWARDFVFVISDGHLDGMHAFLSEYHGSKQSNLDAEPLALSSGVIWTALNIDYPGHSFSHLGMFFEGLNGRLPNQDLLNSFFQVARYTGGVPVVLYDHLNSDSPPKGLYSHLPAWIINIRVVKTYLFRAKNILRHVNFQARGRPSGVHGLFHQFRIDAFTIYAIPAEGPHGFHAIGRIIESTLRTTNNLLERLHASFFFYLMASSNTFLKIGNFLPSVVLVSVAMMCGGLGLWVDAAWIRVACDPSGQKRLSHSSDSSTWRRRQRPVLPVLTIIAFTHALGLALFFVVNLSLCMDNRWIVFPTLFVTVTALPLTIQATLPSTTSGCAPPSLLLNALTLCFASTIISVTTVLNFSLAATMAILLGLPLSLACSPHRQGFRMFKYASYAFLGFGWLIVGREEAREAIWYWDVMGDWFAPFVCIVYGPLALQGGIVSLLL